MKKKTVVIGLLLILFIAGAGALAYFSLNKNRPVPTSPAEEKNSLKYWTCAMHPSVHSDKPGKCPICGMDLIQVEKQPSKAVARQERADIQTGTMAPEAVGSVSLTKEAQELSGIATVRISKENVFKEIRTVGKVAYDPGLTIAQEEFLIALETLEKVGKSPDKDVIERAQDLVARSKFRLKVLGMGDQQIQELQQNKQSQWGLILPQGKAWIYADIYEYDLGWIKDGLKVKVVARAYPGEEFSGVIKAINTILDPNTRSVKVRSEVNDPSGKLRPEMFVDVFIRAELGNVLALERQAVLDTGTRSIVWVDKGDGNFEAREIKTGPEGFARIDGQIKRVFPVLSGLREGESVVTKGNFLLDSQSQLTGGMSLQWGAAAEIKEEDRPQKETPVQTQHKH